MAGKNPGGMVVEQFLHILLSRLWEYFNPERLATVAGTLLINSLLAALVLSIFYFAWQVFNRMITPRLQSKFDKTSIAFATTMIKFTFMAVGILAAMSAAGIQTKALMTSLGVVGLTIGFALRETLSNIVAGILIFLDRPFTIDDLVDIDGQYGRVDRISLRTTRIVTNDGKMLAVPNAVVMNKTVASYTNFPNLRLDIVVAVAMTENLDRVRKLLLSTVEEDTDYLSRPLPRVVVTQLNDYNVTLELQAWLKNERLHVEKSFALREKVFRTLHAAGVEMPFETIQLTPHRVTVAMSGNESEKKPNPDSFH